MKDFIILCAKIALGIFIAGALILGSIKGPERESLLSKTKDVMQSNLEFQKNYP